MSADWQITISMFMWAFVLFFFVFRLAKATYEFSVWNILFSITSVLLSLTLMKVSVSFFRSSPFLSGITYVVSLGFLLLAFILSDED